MNWDRDVRGSLVNLIEPQGEGVEREDPMSEGYHQCPECLQECPNCNEYTETGLQEIEGLMLCEPCRDDKSREEIEAILNTPRLNITAKVRLSNEVLTKYGFQPDLEWCSHCQKPTQHEVFGRLTPCEATPCAICDDGGTNND